LELNYIVEEDVPSWVKGDKVRIRQVLLNVIGNAIKFTPEGEVFSRCRVFRPGASEPHDNEIMLEFAIIDTGRGFTKQEAELIFKPFSQIDGSSTRQHGGSGLGLVISRQLVELHGGKMEGTAVPGQGSTFTFSARFGLPTEDDHPDAPMSPREAPSSRVMPEDVTTHPTFQQFAFQYNRPSRPTPVLISPSINDPPPSSLLSPPAPPSSGGGSSSDPPSLVARGSVVVTTRATERSSMSSSSMSAAGLVRFSEAARASGADLSQMKLEIPSRRSSPGTTTPTAAAADHHVDFRPPMYSILIICPQIHSREATTKHIKMTLPKDVPHQITPVGSVQEAQRLISGEDAVVFTHIVVNLPSSEEIINLMDQLKDSRMIEKTNVLILSDSVQRQAVSKLTANTHHEGLLSETRVTYIYKPVKPSRFAVIFDPAKERDLSIDRNRSTAQRLVENQRQSYLEVEKRMGNKGYRVLLVEDNPVNQKVLRKYLRKVGVDVDVAADGVECTDRVFEHPHDFYSLILVSISSPSNCVFHEIENADRARPQV
ncbi:MAG: ATP-binding protein, partial [Thaumarchaeota archaeon]|nr:ATP-binding protein [Nitrososphaerota archaeon]